MAEASVGISFHSCPSPFIGNPAIPAGLWCSGSPGIPSWTKTRKGLPVGRENSPLGGLYGIGAEGIALCRGGDGEAWAEEEKRKAERVLRRDLWGGGRFGGLARSVGEEGWRHFEIGRHK